MFAMRAPLVVAGLILVELLSQGSAQGSARTPAELLSPDTLEALWAHVVPGEGEQKWRAIGWRAVLAEAMAEAHAADRPVLLWAMNGHPLACT